MLQDFLKEQDSSYELASQYLNPKLVQVMDILGFNQIYTQAQSCYLFTQDGKKYLDFHSGEGFQSLGHNHPRVKEVLKEALDSNLPDGTQIHFSSLSGLLAKRICQRLPDSLSAVFFTNSGTETVETALKFSRFASGRGRLLSCENGYHGLTYGALSVSSEDYFKKGFGPLLPDCDRVPFNDLEALERELQKKDVAAFIVEPVQGRALTLPDPSYFQEVARLCKKYGTFLIFDEIQTGLGRTGKWFALEHWDIEPDFVLIAKALSGGFMPVGAMITRREIYNRVVNTLDRCYVQHSTYGRNKLAMLAGLATLEVIETEKLVERAHEMGERLKVGMESLKQSFSLIKDVRGLGLMLGFELGEPKALKGKIEYKLIQKASKGLFPQLVVIPLHKDHQIISMASGHNDVIKLLPPLVIQEAEVDYFVNSLQSVLSNQSGPWNRVMKIALQTMKGSVSHAFQARA
ncbi:MAG: aspartate aminotransferase family protein [Bradymonadales bacterium]|nr:MAG: aspartate aminotransferase family protein [Bradymonadales bacterium]